MQWFDPGWQLSPTQSLAKSHCFQKDGGREQEKQKIPELVGQNRNSLISEEKRKREERRKTNKTSDAKEITHHFPQ